MKTQQRSASKYQECTDLCAECAIACEVCLAEMAGVDSRNDCPKCCVECAAVCNLCVRFMAWESVMAGQVCRICAEICDWCADQCGEHEHDHCQRCVEMCRNCAYECRRMVV